jgi:hypothetical protein
VKVFDRLAQKLALRWLKGKVGKARQEGSHVLKAVDGWKSLIVVLGFIASSVYALASGQDVGALIQVLLGAMGWVDGDMIARAKAFATVVAPLLLAIWAAGSRLSKAMKQYRAGAKVGELLSTEGYVKQARAEGLIPPKE